MILCPVALLVVPSFPESCSPSARPTVFTHSLVGAFGVISYLTAYFFDSKIDEMDPQTSLGLCAASTSVQTPVLR